MKIPKRLEPLLEDGLIDHVIKPLRSGKEADVFVVVASDEVRCAKIYKEKTKRSFHNQVLYQEGRHTKNSRSSRAMGKHTKYGKQVEEEEWQNSEVDTLFRLHAAGVCVPVPHICMSGVLIMELLLDENGQVAPQLGDIQFDPEEAAYCHDYLLREVIKMLLAGVVHADLSEFNVVMTYNGPVIIDFPQAVDATSNNNAQYFFERDVRNLTHFFGRFEPSLLEGNYGLEIWQHYGDGTLTPEMVITGKPVISTSDVNIQSVFREIEEAREEAERKAMRLAGIDPDESNEMSEWFEPKRKQRVYTQPSVEASPTSPNRSDQSSKQKSNHSSGKPKGQKQYPKSNPASSSSALENRSKEPAKPPVRETVTPRYSESKVTVQRKVEMPAVQRKVEMPAFSTSVPQKPVELQPTPPLVWGRR